MDVRATEHDLATVPKVELHVHLNGSITEATASTLAERHGADPTTELGLVDGRYPGTYPDFEGFLAAYLKANAFRPYARRPGVRRRRVRPRPGGTERPLFGGDLHGDDLRSERDGAT